MSDADADATPQAVHHVADVALEPDPLPDEQILAGAPEVSARELWSAPGGGASAGVWEHTEGVSSDVEADEVFIVISGRATIAVEDGPTLEVGPGDVATLRAGQRTVWTVHEPLRKVYFVQE
jgi:uncharacterized cupin superfamily protein